MPAVTGAQIGLDSSNTQFSYGMESAWASLPATTFQAARIISNSLKHTKTRSRPPEIRGDRQAAPAITTQENASGTLVFPVYYSSAGKASPFDDYVSCLVGNDWAAVTNIVGVAADVVGTWSSGPGTFVLSTVTANKFLALAGAVGSIVKLKGFTTNPVNNGFYRLSAYTSALNITLIPQGFTPVTETPTGTNFNLYYSGLKNSNVLKTTYGQQRLDLAGTKFMRYPAIYPNKGTFTLNLGQFFQASVDCIAQQELKGLTDASSGGIVAAPTTFDLDPVGGFKGIYYNDTLLATGSDQLTLTMENTGAAGQYILGNSLAQGILQGTFTASASLRLYFSQFTYYDLFKSETPGIISFQAGDSAGNRYCFTAPNAQILFDSGVPIQGVNQSLMATITVEMSPDANSGATIIIDRIPSTA